MSWRTEPARALSRGSRGIACALSCALSAVPSSVGAVAGGDVARQGPVLEVVSAGSSEGHVRLAWSPSEVGSETTSSNGDLVFQLEQSRSEQFESADVRYEGTDTGAFVSGLEAGNYWFRVRSANRGASAPSGDANSISPGDYGQWSQSVHVEIDPHSLTLAWSLFATGGLLVIGIVSFLFVADRKSRGELTPPIDSREDS